MFRDSSLTRRILITLGALAISRIGLHLPVPGIDLSILLETMSTASGWDSAGSVFTLGFTPIHRFSVFALGIWPHLSAAILVLLGSGLIPPLRRLRDGDERRQCHFHRVILGVTVVVGMFQAYAVAVFIQSNLGEIGWMGGVSDSFSPVVVTLVMTAGTLLLVWLAEFITRYGVGNGLALIILSTSLSGFVPALLQEIRSPMNPWRPLAHSVLLIAFALLVFAGVIAFLKAKRTVRLIASEPGGMGRDAQERCMEVPIRMNITGVVPLVLAQTLLAYPSAMANFGLLPASATLQYGSWVYWSANCVLIILGTFLFTAWIFNAGNLLQHMRAWGFRIHGEASDAAARAMIERHLVLFTGAAALFLCALSLVPTALSAWFGMNMRLGLFFGSTLLTVAAIIIDTIECVRRHHAAAADLGEQEAASGVVWVSALTAETRLEVEMAAEVLAKAGIRSTGRYNRAVCAMGSLAPWEVCRPTFPSLVIYRALGQGQATLLVPREQSEEAQRILAPFIM